MRVTWRLVSRCLPRLPIGAERDRRLQLLVGLALLLIYCAVMSMLVPLADGIELGGDEKMELNKATFYASRAGNIDQMWNDQPFLYTVFLGAVLRSTSEPVLVARLATLALFVAFLGYGMLRLAASETLRETLVLVGTLLMWPSVAQLSVSAMQEPVAISLAVMAAGSLVGTQCPRYRRAVLAGVLLAVATQVKLTALLFLPGIAVVICTSAIGTGRPRQAIFPASQSVLRCCAMAVGFGLAFTSIYALLPQKDLVFRTWNHFSPEMKGISGHPLLDFPARMPALLLAAIGLVGDLRRRDFSRLLFPLSTLLVLSAVHLSHRPWWYFYDLHFSVPIALLAARGAWHALPSRDQVIWLGRRTAHGAVSADKLVRSQRVGWVWGSSGVVTTLFLAGWLGMAAPAFIDTLVMLQSAPLSHRDPILSTMRRYCRQGARVYSEVFEYPHWLRAPMPGELVVISTKRIATGQASDNLVRHVLQRDTPDQLVLENRRLRRDHRLSRWVELGYVKVAHYENGSLFVRRELRPEPIRAVEDNPELQVLLGRLGWLDSGVEATHRVPGN